MCGRKLSSVLPSEDDEDAPNEQDVGTAYWDQMWNEDAPADDGDDE